MLLSQINRPNAVSNRTSDPLVSPVTSAELADFTGAENEPLLDSFLLAASQCYIDFTQNELLQRNYTMKLDRSPEESPSYGGISPNYGELKAWTSLRTWPVDSVTSITENDNDITADGELDANHKPARIDFNGGYYTNLVIDYVAGYASAAEIPATALLGIKMMAAYLYEHRGECSVDDAMKNSGATGLWAKDRLMVTL